MPSDQHEVLKARAITWLDARSTGRGVRAGTEVHVAEQYVADVVAFSNPVEAVDKDLLEISYGEVPEPPMRPLPPYAWLFECKVSRRDFLGTFGYEATGRTPRAAGAIRVDRGRACPRANVHLCVTTGKFDVDELPPWWGHLAISGGGLSTDRMPRYCSVQPIDIVSLHEMVMWTGEAKPINRLIRKVKEANDE